MTKAGEQQTKIRHLCYSHPLTAALPSENLADMPSRYTTCFLLIVAAPLLAVATAADEKPVARPAQVPAPPKLERKDYTEKTSGWKTEVLDPDSKPPKT